MQVRLPKAGAWSKIASSDAGRKPMSGRSSEKKDSCEDIIKLNRMPGVGKQHAVLTRPHSWLTIKQKPGKRRSAWNTAQNTHCSNDLALTPDGLIRSGCFSQLPNRQRCCATHCAGAVAEASGQTPWVFMGAEFERRATCMFSAGLGLSLLGVHNTSRFLPARRRTCGNEIGSCPG